MSNCPQHSFPENTILCGDCLELLPMLPPGSVDLVFLDPPYNLGFDYGDGPHADRLPAADYLSFVRTVLRNCVRLLHRSGSLWVLVPERWADEVGTMLSRLLSRRNRIIWRETFGQYREDRFASGHRHLFYHVADPHCCTWEPDAIRIPSARMHAGDKRAAGPRVPDDVWDDIARLVGNARERVGWHPCQLPEALLERLLLCCTRPGQLVLDPMAGSGTTLRVAQYLGRRYLGIEQNRDYVEKIRRRLARPYQRGLQFDPASG